MSHRYRTVLADPPWPFKWDGRAGGRRRNDTTLGYAVVPVLEIMAMTPPLVDVDATLFLWTTQDALHAGSARAVAKAWGFSERVGEFIWRKPNFGTGDFPRIGHETCVIYKRGKGSLRAGRRKDVHSVQTWSQPRVSGNGGKKHSAKPDGLQDLIEQAHHGPYLEMFARRERFGWDTFGDESLGTAEMPEAAA